MAVPPPSNTDHVVQGPQDLEAILHVSEEEGEKELEAFMKAAPPEPLREPKTGIAIDGYSRLGLVDGTTLHLRSLGCGLRVVPLGPIIFNSCKTRNFSTHCFLSREYDP